MSTYNIYFPIRDSESLASPMEANTVHSSICPSRSAYLIMQLDSSLSHDLVLLVSLDCHL